MKTVWKTGRILLAVGLTIYVIATPGMRPDAESVRRALAAWPIVALGFVIAFTQTAWGALRIQRLLADGGARLTTGQSFSLCLIGAFFNIFLPGSTGGDAYRVYAITRGHGCSLSHSIAVISLDRLLGLPPLILVVLLGAALDYEFLAGVQKLRGLMTFIYIAGVVCLVFVAYLLTAGRRLRHQDSGSHVAAPGWLGRLHRLLGESVRRPMTLPLTLLYGFLSHIACIVSCLCFGVALEAQGVPMLRYFLIIPMAMTINAIPGAPGGIGQGELAMGALLAMAGQGEANVQIGVAVMLLFRITNLVVGLAGGVLYALGGKSKPAIADISAIMEQPGAVDGH